MEKKGILFKISKVIYSVFAFCAASCAIIIVVILLIENFKTREGYTKEAGPDCYESLDNRFSWAYENGYEGLYDKEQKCFLRDDVVDKILYSDCIGDSLLVYADKNGKKGFINPYSREIVIEAKYDAAWLFNEGVAAVAKEGKIGFIDKKGNLVIPFKFPLYESKIPYSYRFYNGYCKMTDKEGLCGLIDHKGDWVLQPTYEKIKKPELNNYRKVRMNDKWGFIDDQFNIVLPMKYDYVELYSIDPLLYEVTENGKMYKIDEKGEKITEGTYHSMTGETYEDRYIVVRVMDELNYDNATLEYLYKYGIYDILKLKEVVPATYSNIRMVVNGNSIMTNDINYVPGDNLMFICTNDFPDAPCYVIYDSFGNKLDVETEEQE